VFRYLAALTPLLGLALAGCGGLLGSVDGSGTGGAPRLTFVSSGQGFVEGNAVGRAIVPGANDLVVPNAQVRVLRRTGTGANDVAVVATTTANAQGQFSVNIDVDNSAGNLQNNLWEVEVFGIVTIGGLQRQVLLVCPFVPSAGTTNLDVDIATTLVAVRLREFGALPPALVISNLQALKDVTQTRLRNGTSGGSAVSIADVTVATGPNLISVATALQALKDVTQTRLRNG